MNDLQIAQKYVKALGGVDNIAEIDHCITRLRLTMVDMALIDDKAVIAVGNMGTIHPGDNKLQIIIGPKAVQIADEMHEIKGTTPKYNTSKQTADYSQLAKSYIDALGGVANIKKLDNCITRLRLTINDMSLIHENDLENLGNKGVIHQSETMLHVVIGMQVTGIADEMRKIYEK